MLVGVALEGRIEQVDVPERELYRFPGGMVGFEEFTRYALFQLDDPFFLLQAVEDPDVGFVLLDPFLLDSSYRVELDEAQCALLGLAGAEPHVLLCIATLSPEGLPVSANLRAPLVVNPRKLLGTQVILHDNAYPVRYPLSVSPEGCLVLPGQASSRNGSIAPGAGTGKAGTS